MDIWQDYEIVDSLSEFDNGRPWGRHKMINSALANLYDFIDPKKAERLRKCADFVQFRILADGSKKLDKANFCRVRLCPMCQWRRGLKTFSQISQCFDYFAREKLNYKFVLLTLTVRNCAADELKESLDSMQAAWNRFRQQKAFKQAFKGVFKSWEITHNLRDNSFHPHYHIICAVAPSYFKSRYYLSHEKLVAMWRKAARLDYDPQVDVRRIKGDSAGAIAEVAKYAVKPSDYIFADDIDYSIEVIRLLDKVLDNRRFLSFCGCFKDAQIALKLDDIENGDLVHLDDDSAADDDNSKVVSFAWISGYNRYQPEN